jgi:polysaccharide biosynthesis/export protein
LSTLGSVIPSWKQCTAVLGLWVAQACSPVSTYPYAQEPDPRAQEYVLDVPDSVRVTVWNNRDLNTQANIRPDGTFTMPLVGDVPAAGKTPSQLKAVLVAKLREFVKLQDENSVTVEVTGIGSYRITVSGQVSNPGVLSPTHYLTVSEAITLSGGPNKFADPDDVEIVRTREDGKVVRIPIRYDLLERGEALEQDIVLLRGDLVYVP